MIVAGLLIVQATLLAWSAWRHSPTLNEPGHLAAGISHWQFGRFELYRVNPPLVRMVAALPVLAAGVETDWSGFYEAPGARPVAGIGERLADRNGSRIFWLMTLARWACIPLVLVGGGVSFFWARDLYGPRAGLLALALWTFSPNVLGHGSLITADVPAAALGLAAAYAFWRWLRRSSGITTVVAGIALGLAELAKFTLLVFYAVWPLLWLIYRTRSPETSGEGRNTGRLRQAGMLAGLLVVSLYVVNLGFGFERSLPRLGDLEFVSSLFSGNEEAKSPGNRFAQSWLGGLRLPVPRNYALGIDIQRRDFEHYSKPSYLRGRFRPTGWWYYYLYGLAVKVPLGVWALAGLVVIRRLEGGWRSAAGAPTGLAAGPQSSPWAIPGPTTGAANTTEQPRATLRDDVCVLLPAAAILTLVSSQTGFSEHVRYALPALPLLFVWISQAARPASGASVPTGPAAGRASQCVAGCRSLAPAVLLAWVVASSLWVFPHSLSYFNELAGGPRGGPAHLIHSNVDWGQDLLYLKRWLDRHATASPFYLAYFGPVDPRQAGIAYRLPPMSTPVGDRDARPAMPEALPPGWYAVSVNFVVGYPFRVLDGEGRQRPVYRDALAYWQRFEPVATAGYSIYIYHIATAGAYSGNEWPSTKAE